VVIRLPDAAILSGTAGPAGTYRQTTDLTDAQARILTTLGITPPPRILDLTPPAKD
jgi:hypothetical protein